MSYSPYSCMYSELLECYTEQLLSCSQEPWRYPQLYTGENMMSVLE